MGFGRFRLIPRDERFFDMFSRSAENTLEGARLLVEIFEHPDNVERRVRHIKDIEHQGDEITHEVFAALNRTFVTPLDREDISRLAAALDDVIDFIEEAARRVRLFRMNEATPLARKLARVICEQAGLITKAVAMLQDLRNSDQMEQTTREIHRLENEGDDLLAEALAGLYDGITQIPELIQAIRWGDIYQLLEDATDRAEQVAVVLRDIAVKNA